jgi:hypothetical protein
MADGKRRGNPAMAKGAPSLNPKGKPAGNRDRLCRELLADMADAWRSYGIRALKEMAQNDPSSFALLLAGAIGSGETTH